MKLTAKKIPIWNRRLLELKDTAETDKEWCKKIGIVQANMRGYQEGTRSFTIKQLIIAAKMYNTTLDYLCGLTDKRPKPDQKTTPLEMIEEGLRILKSKEKR